MFHVPNENRLRNDQSPLFSEDADGNNGAFLFVHAGIEFFCIASDGLRWEHVSVSQNRKKTPTWEQMCFIKAMFWDPGDCVIQYHPPESEYVNNHPYTLHLWRKSGVNVETPPKAFV